MVAYLICYRNDKKLNEQLEVVIDGNEKMQSQLEKVGSDVESVGSKLDIVLSSLNNGDFGITKHLLLNLKDSISKLHVSSAFQYLQTIWKELEISKKGDLELRGSIQYLMGECARYVKELDSREYHEKAYRLMQRGQYQDGEIIEGMVFEACRRKDFEAAKQYADDLFQIAPNSPWCYVPTLMDADDMRSTFDSLPKDNVNMTLLGVCIMMGGGKSHDIGIEPALYTYNDLIHLSTANFPLWIMDLSVATTMLCQNLVVHRNIKLMSNDYAKKVFALTDRFLSLLQNTEIENILPDTVFLHAVTGYFEDQDRKWLDVLKRTKPTADMEEIYYLTYAVILNDASDYDGAKRLLSQYNGGNIASILNMRCILAAQNNDFQECIEVVKYSSNNHVVVPDHLANYYFGTVHSFYDSVKDEIANIEFESELTRRAFDLFINYVSGKEGDCDFIILNKDNFGFSVIPYMAIIAKDKISLSLAIEMLEKCVERSILDLRSSLLINFYLEDTVYNQKLYHLLRDLRKAGVVDTRNLSIELKMSNDIQDFENSLEITRQLIKLLPNDDGAIVNHLQALMRCGGYEEEIRNYKSIFENKIVSSQVARIIFDIFHIIGDTSFAVEFLYNQIESTKNQELKDFFLSIHMNSGIDKVISIEKEVVGISDYVSISFNGESKDVTITPGSVYEELAGCKKGEKKTITIKDVVEVTICDIHTKYFKLLRDIFREIGDNSSSKSIKMFCIDDFDFKNDPLGALQKMAGRTEDVRAKEQALLDQYHRGEMSLLCFIKDHEFFSDVYEKIFGSFRVCIIPNEFFTHLLAENEFWKQKELVLDISSVVVLHEFEMKFGLPDDITFNVPKVVLTVLKEQIINEEKGMPRFFSQQLADRISLNTIDSGKTALWNKLKSIELWIIKRCKVQTVEEVINLDLTRGENQCYRVEVESLLLTRKGMLLLSEDWCYTKKYIETIPTMSCYNWLSLMGIKNADKWGQFMLECGNVGYPMTSDYIRLQYDLAAKALPNNYQVCLENMKFNLLSWEEVVHAAKGLLSGVVDAAKIAGATNMMTILFQNMDEQMCRLIIKKEYIGSRDQLWHQCLVDALKISHPLILPH